MNRKESYGLDLHLARFGTDKQCHDFLVQLRWDGQPQCPKCNNNQMNYYLAKRNVYKCSLCYTQFSITKGTIFERSKIPLYKWFMAIYFFTTNKRGISSVQLGKWLGIRQKTAWFLLHRLREAMKDENNLLLSGIVEADEAYIGPNIARDTRLQKKRRIHNQEQERIHGMYRGKRRKKFGPTKQGRKKGDTDEIRELRMSAKKMLGPRLQFERINVVLGMMERDGRVVMKNIGTTVKNVSRKNIYPLLTKHIVEQSTLITDQLNLYDGTKDLFKEHQTVNHQIGYVIDGIHINGIENAWKHLKKLIIGTYFHFSNHHFERYLNENTYRWNKRTVTQRELFESFFPLILGKRISYKDLICKDDYKLVA